MMQLNFPLATFPELVTPNLRLRNFRQSDAPNVYRIFANDEVTKYYDLETFTSIEQASELIARQQIRYERGEVIRWAIAQKASDVVIGTIGCVVSPENAQGGLGYDLARPYWRRGLMSEALGIVIRFSFRSLKLNRLQALVMPGNVASANLLLKMGFLEEGTLREYRYFKGRFQDFRCFSLLRREFDLAEQEAKR